MNSNINRKNLIIIGFVVTMVFFVLLLLGLSSKENEPQKTPETAGDFSIISINDPSKALYNSFVSNDYLQIKKHLSTFIKSKGGTATDNVTISEVIRPTRDSIDNIYSFKAYIPSLNKAYEVIINKPRDASFPAYLQVEGESFRVNMYELDESNDEFHDH